MAIKRAAALFLFCFFCACPAASAAKAPDAALYGIWAGNGIDTKTKQAIAPCTIRFAPDGKLNTTIGHPGNEYMNTVIYRTENGEIFTNSPNGTEKRARYVVEGDRLAIEVNGVKTVFVKRAQL